MITRSIKREYIKLWQPIFLFFIMMFLLAFGSFMAMDYLPPILEQTLEWPKEMLAFLGMSNVYNGNTGLLVFYLGLIFTNMVAMALCMNSANIMNEDEEWGITIFYLNQPYTKTQIFFLRLIAFLGSVLIKWAGYICAIFVSLKFLCEKLDISFEKELTNIHMIAWKGFPVLFLIATVIVLYSMSESRSMSYQDMALTLCMFSFLLGNAYKVTDYIAYHLRTLQQNAKQISEISETLEKFRCVYPFTLFNILNKEVSPLPENIFLIYSGIGALFLIISWFAYYIKNITQDA